MRRLGGVLIGLVVAVVAFVVLGVGFDLAARALVRLRTDDLYAAFPVLLVGGALLGGGLLAGRISRTAPLTAGAVLLLAAVVTVVDPLAFAALGGRGMVALTSQQVVVTYAAILLVGAFTVRPSGGRAVGAGYSPTPYGVGGPYPPYAPGPPYPPGAPYPPGPPGPYPSAGPGMYPAGPGPYAGGPATPSGGPGSHPGEASPHPGAPERGSAAE